MKPRQGASSPPRPSTVPWAIFVLIVVAGWFAKRGPASLYAIQVACLAGAYLVPALRLRRAADLVVHWRFSLIVFATLLAASGALVGLVGR